MSRTNNKMAKMRRAPELAPQSNLPYWSISSTRTGTSTQHHFITVLDGLPPVRVNYIIFDTFMCTSVSVDDERTLVQHCKAKTMSLDLLRKRPIDGPSDFKLRYYIKFTPETGKWVLSYSAQPEDFDCDKASAVTGMKCDFTMRYCKPPLAGVNNFFWPQGQTWSPVGLYKCQPDGTLEMVRRGDSMVMGRMFFSIGRPTIRIICMPKATDLSVVYKLHCVDPEWIKRVEQHLAKAAGQKPMFGGFLNLLNVGNKRAELPIV